MALTITEYASLPSDSNGNIIGAPGAELASQTVTPGATAANYTVVGSRTNFLRVATDIHCRISLAGAATGDSPPVFADSVDWIAVRSGSVLSYKSY